MGSSIPVAEIGGPVSTTGPVAPASPAAGARVLPFFRPCPADGGETAGAVVVADCCWGLEEGSGGGRGVGRAGASVVGADIKFGLGLGLSLAAAAGGGGVTSLTGDVVAGVPMLSEGVVGTVTVTDGDRVGEALFSGAAAGGVATTRGAGVLWGGIEGSSFSSTIGGSSAVTSAGFSQTYCL